jgi:hypothetical protein
MSQSSISDRDLLAFLDDEVDAGLRAAIEASPAALARAAQLAREQHRLTRHLFRTTCPDSTVLGEYVLEMVEGSDRAVIGTHLESCPHCRAEVAQLTAFLAVPREEPALIERLREVVARLLDDGSAPVLAGVRGQDSGPRLYEAEEAQIALEVQDDSDTGRRAILGLILGPETGGWEARLQLAEEAPVAKTPVDEVGNFAFHDLAPGTYVLLLRGPDVQIRIEDFAV